MDKNPPRSPQEKKSLSYAKDRRNAYGQNDKASRKAIPLRKAMESRRDRRKVAESLAVIPMVDEAAADLIESSALHDVYRVGGWTKAADEPLGKIVASALAAREGRTGRKMRAANATANQMDDDPDALTRMAKQYRRIARSIMRRNPMRSDFAKQFDKTAEDLEARAEWIRPSL